MATEAGRNGDAHAYSSTAARPQHTTTTSASPALTRMLPGRFRCRRTPARCRSTQLDLLLLTGRSLTLAAPSPATRPPPSPLTRRREAGGAQIWIQPEHPEKLTSKFSKLKDLVLWCFFPDECDLNWTLTCPSKL